MARSTYKCVHCFMAEPGAKSNCLKDCVEPCDQKLDMCIVYIEVQYMYTCIRILKCICGMHLGCIRCVYWRSSSRVGSGVLREMRVNVFVIR